MKKTCSFFGHSSIDKKIINSLRAALSNEIHKLIIKENINLFLNGGIGDFDDLCAETVHEIICDKENIESHLILPYVKSEVLDNISHYDHLYNKIFVPTEIKFKNYKVAIPLRNEYIADHSNFIIAYVKENFGGAYTAFDYAKKYSKAKIINLGEVLC